MKIDNIIKIYYFCFAFPPFLVQIRYNIALQILGVDSAFFTSVSGFSRCLLIPKRELGVCLSKKVSLYCLYYLEASR